MTCIQSVSSGATKKQRENLLEKKPCFVERMCEFDASHSYLSHCPALYTPARPVHTRLSCTQLVAYRETSCRLGGNGGMTPAANAAKEETTAIQQTQKTQGEIFCMQLAALQRSRVHLQRRSGVSHARGMKSE